MWGEKKRLYNDLKKFSKLTSLKLSCFEIPDLTRLKTLENLQTLDLEGNYIKRTSDIASLVSLQHLTISNMRCETDLTVLRNLKDLRTLELHGYRYCKCIEAIQSLVNLRVLKLDGFEHLNSILPIGNLFMLKQLSLRGFDMIIDLRPLMKLKSLTRLDLVGLNSVQDISPLANLHQVEQNGLPSKQVQRGPWNLHFFR